MSSDTRKQQRCLSTTDATGHENLRLTRQQRRSSATGATYHSFQSSFQNSNDRRRLRLEKQCLTLQEDLVEDMAKLCLLERRSPIDFSYMDHVDDNNNNNMYHFGEIQESLDIGLVKSLIRTFVTSLPLRYVLSIDSPGEALLHMRRLAYIRRDELNTSVHIKESDSNDITFCTEGSKNVKTIFVCCAHTIGLMEFLMGRLVAGGNEIFDTNLFLSSEKIMLVSLDKLCRIDLLVFILLMHICMIDL